MGFDESESQNSSIFSQRKSVKWLEIPIQKFNEVIPHFVESLKSHQNNILKLRRLEQWEEERKEQISASQIINQLASLLSEMENLRSQVTDSDLNKFDRLISNSKQTAKTAIRTFHNSSSALKSHRRLTNSEMHREEENTSGQEQLMVMADLSEAVKIQERRALSMERLEEDIQDINYMFQELSQLVHDQEELVECVENHVEITHENVIQGERMLARAARYKSGMYPLLGAVMGSVLGGPVGLFAGLKLGSLTAVGAGLLGFTGGKMLKNVEESVISEADSHSQDIKNQA